ncbi:guanyl-specific ribonuclease [Allokutzneria albata]|uniref:Guanyl-specific ribonuclease Sa n=1 Tax=Allokutzneria albata TaxID=211114 RepID=A0A1H0C7B3_ALLAB|nr:ribonuclease domain-containing protein [Allokutzneria albata]SDN53755.1 Guanyl-specific ribonuclease Sa [Allokutzneria albata]
MTSRRRITVALVGLVALVVVGWFARDLFSGSEPSGACAVSAQSKVPGAASGLRVCPLSGLPKEAATTWESIRAGGPHKYPKNDNVDFFNREGVLPAKARGYYREFTVPTPGENTRGARRLVTGQTGEVYYTADHYKSFVVVDTSR